MNFSGHTSIDEALVMLWFALPKVEDPTTKNNEVHKVNKPVAVDKECAATFPI